MRPLWHLGLVGLLALLTPVVAQAQKDPKKKAGNTVEGQMATAADYAALNQYKEIVGFLSNIDTAGNVLTFRVEYEVPQSQVVNGPVDPKNPNKNRVPTNNQQPVREQFQQQQKQAREMQEQQQLLREYEQIMRIQNPQERARRLQQFQQKLQRDRVQDLQEYMRQLARQQQQYQQQLVKGQPGGKNPQGNVKMVKMAKEFELEYLKDLRVARAQLEAEYDDKGNLKQPSAEELKKLKDPVMPGYKAKFTDLMPGQQVKLYLVKRTNTAAKKEQPKKDAPKDQDKEDEAAKDEKKGGAAELPAAVEHAGPRVSMVLILAEAPITPGAEKKKKAK